MQFKCYLDCDGVLADFIGGVCERFGFPESKIFSSDRPRPLPVDLNLLFGIPTEEIWRALDDKFWAGLKVFPWAKTLVARLDSIFDGNVVLCTSPGYLSAEFGAAAAMAGKEQWIMHHFPQFGKRYVFTFNKFYMASPWHILIDDQENSCRRFSEAGGFGIVFPQHWNNRYPYVVTGNEDDLLSVVLEDAEFFSTLNTTN